MTETLKTELKSYGYIIFTNFIYAISINMFLDENNIAAGGFIGIATILSNFIPISIGTINAILNVPGIIYAFINKGFKYIIKTLISIIMLIVFIDLFSFLPTATNDLLTASVVGGFLYALGVVSMNLAGTSSGGSDLIARMINDRFPKLSLGTIFLAFDGFCVLFAIVAFQNIEMGVYATIAIATYSIASDKIFLGLNYASICYVISKDCSDKISRAVIEKLNRSATIQKATGAYKQEEQSLMMIIVRPSEVYDLKKLVKDIDQDAFVVVSSAKEVLGSGFENISLK